MKLTLAYCPVACSMVPYILLTEAKAEFETMVINLGKAEHLSEKYLALNPKGKVPTLLIDGQALTENIAIQVWIAQQFPSFELMPKEPLKFAQALSVMSWCSSAIHPKLTQQARPEGAHVYEGYRRRIADGVGRWVYTVSIHEREKVMAASSENQ